MLTVACCALAWVATLAAAVPHSAIQPSHHAARINAHHIFNAIHSAGRQWGSSFNHNGFSFFPAVMPKGTLLYHGSRSPEIPTTPEWLAFEVEHAENFALSFRRPDDGRRPNQTDMARDYQDHHDNDKILRGYFHTYQAKRDLKLLYIDGMSAGKTQMGTLDSQDLVLRENNTQRDDIFEDWNRAVDLCDIVTTWGYDGVMRDEIGFEVIHCDFNDGLNFISARRTFLAEDKIGTEGDMRAFQWARAVGQRYDGVGQDRVRFDFSSMVSGFFFPINVSSIDPERPDLIRLAASPLSDLKGIKTYLCDVAVQAGRFTINWQAIVDMITTRFADRFAFMATQDISMSHFIDELEAITLLYVDAPQADDEALPSRTLSEAFDEAEQPIHRCMSHFLLPAHIQRNEWSPEDNLVHTAIWTVVSDICNNLFTMRELFLELEGHGDEPYKINKNADSGGLQLAFKSSRALMRSMMNGLAWTIWKGPRKCPVDQVSFIAMWPFGSKEDHWRPGCRSIESIAHGRFGYWSDAGLHSLPEESLFNDEL